MREVVLRVLRWSPEDGERVSEYRAAVSDEATVLDALVSVQQEQDPGLVFRYACRVGMCGSCAMVINGRERWACRSRLVGLGDEVISVRPLYHFPVLRDLLVDMTPFTEKMRAVAGAHVAGRDAPDYARIGGDAPERRAIDPAIECIGCGMCLSACTLVAHDERFPGPAALNRAFTLARDSRDAAGEARWAVLLSDDGLARCHGQGNCTDVCPMGLAPTASILALRRMAVRRMLRFRPFFRARGRPVVP